jgi:plastocyanin
MPAVEGSMPGQPTTASDVNKCASCAGKGMAPMVEGTVTSENGSQIVAVGIKDGYYSPNTFTVKAGEPVKVVFTGKATGCLANPTFKSLNKTVNIEQTGAGTIDLGVLTPGTYEFSCKMGMTGGKITVQ